MLLMTILGDGRSGDDVGVVDAFDDATEDGVLPVKLGHFLERDVELAGARITRLFLRHLRLTAESRVRSLARCADDSTLKGPMPHPRRKIRIRRIPRPVIIRIVILRERVAALYDAELLVYAMEGRAVIKSLFDQLLEAPDGFGREVRIKLYDHFAEAGVLHFDDGHFRVGLRLDPLLDARFKLGLFAVGVVGIL